MRHLALLLPAFLLILLPPTLGVRISVLTREKRDSTGPMTRAGRSNVSACTMIVLVQGQVLTSNGHSSFQPDTAPVSCMPRFHECASVRNYEVSRLLSLDQIPSTFKCGDSLVLGPEESCIPLLEVSPPPLPPPFADLSMY